MSNTGDSGSNIMPHHAASCPCVHNIFEVCSHFDFDQAATIINKLRSMPFAFTTETGKPPGAKMLGWSWYGFGQFSLKIRCCVAEWFLDIHTQYTQLSNSVRLVRRIVQLQTEAQRATHCEHPSGRGLTNFLHWRQPQFAAVIRRISAWLVGFTIHNSVRC